MKTQKQTKKEYVIYRKPINDVRTIVRKPAFNFNVRDMNPKIEDNFVYRYVDQ